MGCILAFLSLAVAGSWESVFEDAFVPPQRFSIEAYSEFTPPVLLGVRPYEALVEDPARALKALEFVGRDAAGDYFKVSRFEESRWVQPGLHLLATELGRDVGLLATSNTRSPQPFKAQPLVIESNPYWPKNFPKFSEHPVVAFFPLALSRTQQQLGRFTPWTVFGGGEVSWEELFFKVASRAVLCGIISRSFSDTSCEHTAILTRHPERVSEDLRPLLYGGKGKFVRYLITFEPWERWPDRLRAEYSRRGATPDPLYVLPHPASLAFSEVPFFKKGGGSQMGLALALSPYAKKLHRRGGDYGLRLLAGPQRFHRLIAWQSLREGSFDSRAPAPSFSGGWENHFCRNRDASAATSLKLIKELNGPLQGRPRAFLNCVSSRSTHRDFATKAVSRQPLFKRVFEAHPELMGLYEKPLAKNIQLWGVEGPLAGQWILDGGPVSGAEIQRAADRVLGDLGRSLFQYREYYPPMQINRSDAVWYRPVFTVYRKNRPIDVDTTRLGVVRVGSEWFPARLGTDRLDLALVQSGVKNNLGLTLKKIAEFSGLLDSKLPWSTAFALIDRGVYPNFAQWRQSLPGPLASLVDEWVTPASEPTPAPVTYAKTVTDEFERQYWKHLVWLTDGPFTHKNNSDCSVTNENTRDPHCQPSRPGRPDLQALADSLVGYYKSQGIGVFRHRFRWNSAFDFSAWEGFLAPHENIVAVIHGTDGRPHPEAIILADHYDTAYMDDVYEGPVSRAGGRSPAGHRHASAGADDNHSATAALMQAALVLNRLPLKKDVWLVHLTGEEYPADCMGARELASALIENRPLIKGRPNPRIAGVYVMDMIGHSTDRDKNRVEHALQISPGRGVGAAKLAHTVLQSALHWNRGTALGNRVLGRGQDWVRFRVPSNRSYRDYPLPELGKLLSLRPEIRPGWHFRSALYNTDVQVFSDAGFPAVLLMENYEIDRKGYHDSLDTLENIDLDYARAVVSIAIEAVAQEASR